MFFFSSLSPWAQERTITGTVRSASDQTTLPGVNVSVKEECMVVLPIWMVNILSPLLLQIKF